MQEFFSLYLSSNAFAEPGLGRLFFLFLFTKVIENKHAKDMRNDIIFSPHYLEKFFSTPGNTWASLTWALPTPPPPQTPFVKKIYAKRSNSFFFLNFFFLNLLNENTNKYIFID